MIDYQKQVKQPLKAVGLISGGLDSSLAAKIMKDMGVDVHGVYFAMPWGCCDKAKATELAQKIGIKFIVLQLDERYLEIVRKPKHGYGTALNPCRDCRIHMFSRAAQYMKHIGADFVFTGEVIGQRPMSQKRDSMGLIEKETGLKGRLLRPLCAQLMEPTLVEAQGLLDRDKLLDFAGRGRQRQIKLADELDIPYNQPAGGCSLTDPQFANRMSDTLKYGYRNFRETIALKWGRHFRIDHQTKVILGRRKEENESLMRYAHPDDIIMQHNDNLGPTLILKKKDPTIEQLKFCAGMIQFYSKFKKDASINVRYWLQSNKNDVRVTTSCIVTDAELEKFRL